MAANPQPCVSPFREQRPKCRILDGGLYWGRTDLHLPFSLDYVCLVHIRVQASAAQGSGAETVTE